MISSLTPAGIDTLNALIGYNAVNGYQYCDY